MPDDDRSSLESLSVARSENDDYTDEMAATRRKFLTEYAGAGLDNVGHYSVDASMLPGNIENFIGVAQVPLGVAGPLLVNGEHVDKEEGWADAGHNWLWLERIGDEPIIAVVSSFESFADMAPDEQSFFEFIAEKTGSAEDAGEIFKKFGSGFESSDYTVWVYDADLSTPSNEE